MVDRVMKNTPTKSRTSTASPPARPFQCQWHEGCPKSFNRKSDLQRHYRIHTNERPYACDYKPCEKTFIQRSALTVHRRTHTGDKPHKCPYTNCGKCFSDSSSLARHRRIHTNDKPYICKNAQCRKAFCRKTTMTKHFRKEHPAESLDQEEDADYSDVDASDDEPSLDRDGTDTPSSADYMLDHNIKAEATSNAAANNYNANLWRLPAQTAQRSAHPQLQLNANLVTNDPGQGVKLERSLSHSAPRNMTEPALVPLMGYTSRANTLPNNIPRSHSQELAMWEGPQLQESPISMTPEKPFPIHHVSHPTSAPTHFQQPQSLPIRRPSLQPVHDIILDDPQQAQYSHGSQQDYHSASTPHYSGVPDFHDEMPRTPAPGQHMSHFSPIESTAPYQEPQALPMEEYNHSSTGNVYTMAQPSLYMDPLDAYKELKTEDNMYTQMPEAIYRWR